MTLHDLDRWFSDLLDPASVATIDDSRNGLQVARRAADIARVAFAVDASLEAFRRAADGGADALVVHHGILWGEPVRLVGSAYDRVRLLVERDVALFAFHLPLDIHPEVGNNAGLARRLGLLDVEPFGLHRGVKIGCKGRLPVALPFAKVVEVLGEGGAEPVRTLAFGPPVVRTVGIVAGSAAAYAAQAVPEGLDAFVTGEPAHQVYHYCREERLNAIFAGHYRTETFGVKALADRLAEDTGLATTWIEVPTGL